MTKSIIFYVLLLTIFAIVAAQKPTTTDTKGTKPTGTTGTKPTGTTGTKPTDTKGTKPTCANSKITCPDDFELDTSKTCYNSCSKTQCCSRQKQTCDDITCIGSRPVKKTNGKCEHRNGSPYCLASECCDFKTAYCAAGTNKFQCISNYVLKTNAENVECSIPNN